MSFMGKFIQHYFGFVFGVIFGSVVATIVTFYAVKITYGDTPQVEALDIQECLIEKMAETSRSA